MTNPIKEKVQALQIPDQDSFEEEILAKFGEIPEVFPPYHNYYDPNDTAQFINWDVEEYDPEKGYISFSGETNHKKQYYQSKYYILSEGLGEGSILAHREIYFDKVDGLLLFPVMAKAEFRQKELRLAYEVLYHKDPPPNLGIKAGDPPKFNPTSGSVEFSYVHLDADYFDVYSSLATISFVDWGNLEVSIKTGEFEEIKKSRNRNEIRFNVDRINSVVIFGNETTSFGESFEDKNTGYVFTVNRLEDNRLKIDRKKDEKSWELIVGLMTPKGLDEKIREPRDGWKDTYKIFPAELNIDDDSQPILPQSPNELQD